MPPPTPVETERYCSLLEFEFEINQHKVRPEEKEKLAVIGNFLTKYPNTRAEIEGHTDDVGSDAANQALSERRADAVVAYLVDTFAISPSRISAMGYGESRPIADNATEAGKRANRRIGAIVDCATDVEGLSVRPARTTMALAVEFDATDASVRPEYRDELRRLAEFMKANPRVTATVEGHTGNLQATAELALQISRRRAQSVVNYLVDNFAIERSRLDGAGVRTDASDRLQHHVGRAAGQSPRERDHQLSEIVRRASRARAARGFLSEHLKRSSRNV